MRKNVIRGKARRDRLEPHVTSNQEAGADQQHQRDRQFGDHQQPAHPVASDANAAIALRAAASGFEGRIQIDFHGPQRRGKAKQNAGYEGYGKRECQNSAVDVDIIEPRNITGIEGADYAQGQLCDHQADRSAGHRQQNAFGQQLTDDAIRTRPQRGADRDFLLAAAARASSRLATLAQAISSTSATTQTAPARLGGYRPPPGPAV